MQQGIMCIICQLVKRSTNSSTLGGKHMILLLLDLSILVDSSTYMKQRVDEDNMAYS